MNRTRTSLLALVVALAGALAACSGSGSGDPETISIATGGTSGTYYPLGGGMAQIFTDEVVNATAESTGASVVNMQLIKDGDVDLAFVQSDIADYASKGVMMFEEGGAIENVQAVASLYNETIQIVVPESSDIRSVEDLAGKKVSIGEPGSGTEANARQILEIHGMSEDDLGQVQRLGFGDSTSYIQDGTLDAAFVTAGTPTSAVSELAATKGVRIVGMTDENIEALIEKYPYYAAQTVEGGTYAGFDETVNTVAVKAQLVVRSELSEDLVYRLTKALFENLDAMAAVHAKASEIALEKALEGVSLTVHPGAAKYFEEAGVQ
ncbi:TAXI family TRAP transporter solute-binding subunit [Paenibacillus antri]|uniref:TAXI family TRAP transporter solute-binding subunit n=1 Tax=Paenibacillus antri TaxID=2582848 RepID=A0A5R9GFK0_9BACL|nr:TAXI family TRAP transporter solute-binding subunit [Paenibacillus antri]TLS53166.1 TAXI family TRAP transporter solute-binding subunit [Paenibacillus antri]